MRVFVGWQRARDDEKKSFVHRPALRYDPSMAIQHFDCIILGAGASGLVCGATAARQGRRVAFLDHAAKPARKLLISGGGKCNLTNLHLSYADYAGENPQFARSALAGLTPAELLEQVRGKGIPLEEREHGQIFCKRSAHDMAVFLLDACHEAGCSFFLGQRLVAPKTWIGLKT